MPTCLAQMQKIMLEVGEDQNNTDNQSIWLQRMQDCIDLIFTFTDWGDIMQLQESIATVNGTKKYGLQTSAYEAVIIRDKDNNKRLEKTDLETLIYMNYDMELTGRPSWWYPVGYNSSTAKYEIEFYKIPDAIYNLQVVEEYRNSVLTSGGSVPLPNDFLKAVNDYLRSKHFYEEGDLQQADRYETAYITFLNLKKTKANTGMDIVMGYGDVPEKNRLNPALFPDNAQG